MKLEDKSRTEQSGLFRSPAWLPGVASGVRRGVLGEWLCQTFGMR